MPLILLAFCLYLGLGWLEITTYLPLNFISWLHLPKWTLLTLIFVVSAWCIGD